MSREYSKEEKQKKRPSQLTNSIEYNEEETENNPLGLGLDLNNTTNHTPKKPKDNYNEENGDLFYGLASERGKYIKETNPQFVSDSPESSPMIIDVYNNEISRVVLNKNAKKPSTNRLSNFINEFKKDKLQNLIKDPKKYSRDIKVNDNLQKDIDSGKRGKYPLWNDYFEIGNKNPKFNISHIFKETANEYDSDYYHTWHIGGNAAPRLLWKRGSKLGIEMAANNGKTKIHFVLDGLNIEQIVHKEKDPDPKKAGLGESITASELRYAYRNRERLAGRIHFYENGEETIAPWEKNSELWQQYIPKNKSRSKNIITQRNHGSRYRLNEQLIRLRSLLRRRRRLYS